MKKPCANARISVKLPPFRGTAALFRASNTHYDAAFCCAYAVSGALLRVNRILEPNISASSITSSDEVNLSSAVVRVENRPDSDITERTKLDATQDLQRSELIQRAAAEQARRSATCARACIDALLAHVEQPWLIVDRDAVVIRWSERLEQTTSTTAAAAVGKPLTDLLCPALHLRFLAAFQAVKCSPIEVPFRILEGDFSFLPSLTTSRITLIAQHRIPGAVEAILILLVPAPAARF